MTIRPIDIARKLHISTNTLRHYEEWGIVPPVERGPNGYRIYTELHVAYFECIRVLNDGIGMQKTAQMMKLTLQGRTDEALWILSQCQAELYQDKLIAEKAVQALETEDTNLLPAKKGKKGLTIGEISVQTMIPTTAIRHWEKAGLLTISRDRENGYRVFTPANLRQILIIRTLKTAFWSLDIIKQIISELDDNQVATAIKTAREALLYLNHMNRNQLRGASYFHRLMDLLTSSPA
ncbi:MerR family transcriptional regulator [Paenibacillus sp. NPDC056579]|uniref:MerR family transcriptional regulator n=1 Tax=Paenibacillus sp. NPDC056579 TaxID=3345871 RepID=UPI0036AD2957